jgi:hypothetical protein
MIPSLNILVQYEISSYFLGLVKLNLILSNTDFLSISSFYFSLIYSSNSESDNDDYYIFSTILYLNYNCYSDSSSLIFPLLELITLNGNLGDEFSCIDLLILLSGVDAYLLISNCSLGIR